jgi:hypothetical protein
MCNPVRTNNAAYEELLQMCQQTEIHGMFTDQRFRFAKSTRPAAADHAAFGSRLLIQDKFVPSLALSGQNITKRLPAVSSSPLLRRIFGNRVLWQRQSRISWKWIHATSRVREEAGYTARSER